MSDPNDIIQRGLLPSRLEKVADAGGFEERSKQKSQEEMLEKMNNIPEQKWNKMLDSIISLETIVDKGGFDSSLISDWTDDIKDAFKTEINSALAPLKNELMSVINEILGPILPLIKDALAEITTMTTRGIGFLEALFTGKLDEFMRGLQLEMQDEVQQWQVQRTEAFWSSPAGKYWFKQKYGMDLDALSAKGTAGGVHSGQFDLDPETLAKLLEAFELGDFTG